MGGSMGQKGTSGPLFTVVPPKTPFSGWTTPFVLHRDNWDDYDFKTQYQLEWIGTSPSVDLGSVKILRLGQTGTARGVLEDGPLHSLDESFCSVGQSLDYYERMAGLPEHIRSEVLMALRDVVAHPEFATRFTQEPGWGKSLFRDTDEREFREMATVMLTRNYDRLTGLGDEITFSIPEMQEPLKLNFSGPSDYRFSHIPFLPSVGTVARPIPPRRIIVLTGANGCGKSTLLSRMARVFHASQPDRSRAEMASIGSVSPSGIGFSRIVTVSYSAFDAFQVPGVDERERRQIASDLEAGVGRFIFCGLRDIAKELKEEVPIGAPQAGGEDAGLSVDRRRRTHLKSLEELANEFSRVIRGLNEIKANIFSEVLKKLMEDPSFRDMSFTFLSDLQQNPADEFLKWSTGHKIVLHSLAGIVAYTEKKSILFVDEPESHLHPPLLAAYMHCVRFVLEQLDAFAIVATHSPVVAQETLGRHVRVIKRAADEIRAAPARIETFGESIGEITDEIFGLNSETTSYHFILDGILSFATSVEAVEAVLQGKLSLQARAYVMSRLAARGAA